MAIRGCFEYLATQSRSLADAQGFRRKYHNIQFRREGGHKPRIRTQLFEQAKRRLPSPFQPARKFAAFFQWKQPLRRPQRCRSRPPPPALQAYLTQMQFVGAEIRVRRIVFIKSSDSGVAKEHTTTPIR